MNVLEIKNITKKFEKKIALDCVSCNIKEGKIFGLLGPNGAGKTTLIRIINQILLPDQGEVLYKGRKISLDDLINFGYLPEERGLYKKMKVGEQLLYLSQLKGLSRKEAIKQAKYYFEKFEITTWWDKKVEELSKGMQQKVQFIGTILHNPEVIILDEPFTGLDPINISIFKKEILELKAKNKTIIISTHIMPSVEELCDEIVLINNSKKVLEGEVYEIKNRFKENIYEVEYSKYADTITISHNINYKIINTYKTNNNTSIYFIKIINNDYTSADLLKDLLNSGEIIRFNEILPTMEEIFVKVVKENEVCIRN
ncbi:MAG: ATP-binding cassette domain-containing protein [Bacteroidales bacterium]|nr:ATP-binding cassette domain-containing protein [Bacteroidales bacterium]